MQNRKEAPAPWRARQKRTMEENALELRGLTRSFDGFTLGPIDLALPEGCILGLIGENGAGKTTTIKLLLGLLRPDAGEAYALNRRVAGADGAPAREAAWKAEIGAALDEPGLPDCMSAAQLGRMFRHVYPAWDDAAFARLLDRLHVPAGKPFSALSRGTRMKLGLAVALSHGAKLLLLDEATSGLDPLVRDDILTLLMEFTRDERHAVLLSSHIVSDLEKACDYIALLHRGKLLLCDEKDRLAERFGVVRGEARALAAIDPAAVRGRRDTPYGTELLVERALLPAGTQAGAVNLEELFLYLAREAG